MQYYLAHFRSQRTGAFAWIIIQPGVAMHALEAVAFDLKCLVTVGLFPVVDFGAGGGAAQRKVAKRLCAMLNSDGIQCSVKHQTVSSEQLLHDLESGIIPLLAVADRDPASWIQDLGTTLGAWSTSKVVFLHRAGAIVSKQGPVTMIDLSSEYERYRKSDALSEEQQNIIEIAHALLIQRPDLSISLTSPLDLLRELFTVKGAGTLLRTRSEIQVLAPKDVSWPDVTHILEDSFERKLHSQWFRGADRIYLAPRSRGVAVVSHREPGAYLTKFAVTTSAQGSGVGGDLWQAVLSDYTKLFWRARSDNRILPWYMERSEGHQVFDKWYVFWRGLDLEQLSSVIHAAASYPSDFEP